MSKVITIKKTINISETIEKAISNIENIDKDTKELLISYMNDAYNNNKLESYDILHHIEENRQILLEISKSLNHNQLKAAFNSVLHSLTVSGYANYGNANMIRKMGELLADKDIEINILLEENNKLKELIKKCDDEIRIKADELNEACLKAKESFKRQNHKKPPSITDLMEKFWNK